MHPIRTARGLLLSMLLLSACHAQAADQLIADVASHTLGYGITRVDIQTNLQLRLSGPFTSRNGHEFRAPATAADRRARTDWQQMELSFDEADNPITRVGVEGSTQRGYQVTLVFREPMHAVTIPQTDTAHISVRAMANDRYARLVRNLSKGDEATRYSIQLNDNDYPLKETFLPHAIRNGRVLYQLPGGDLRLGFYKNESHAKPVLEQLRGEFPNAETVAIDKNEMSYAAALAVMSDPAQPADQLSEPQMPDPPAVRPRVAIAAITPSTIGAEEPAPQPQALDGDTKLDDSLIKSAKAAFIAKDFPRAINLYTKAMEIDAFRQEAMEMLAVSREANRQFAHAKHLYEGYLQEYPSGREHARVQARLAALVAIDQDPVGLRQPNEPSSPSWDTTAFFSQFYRRYTLDIADQNTSVPINGLYSDLSVDTRRISPTTSHELRVSIGHVLDFSDSDDGRDLRLNTVTWESSFEPIHTSFKVGRQRASRGGVLGRWDGFAVGYEPRDNIRVNLLGGYLVDSSFDTFSDRRPVYGINLELSILDDALTLTPFYLAQEFDGIKDREAVGLQANYFADRTSAFGLIDYDIYHQALNNFYLTVNRRANEHLRVYAAYDYRRSPYLTTRNALIGQPLRDLSEFEQSLIDDTLTEIAADRTATSTLYRVGVDGDLGDSWAFAIDGSASDYSETQASANVAGFEAYQSYYYTAQLRRNRMFGDGTYSAVQFRYADSGGAQGVGINLNTRFTVLDNWWVYPRLLWDQRTMTASDQQQTRITPSLRIDYHDSRRFRFEMEVGYEWTTRETVGEDLDMAGIFLRAGYRALF